MVSVDCVVQGKGIKRNFIFVNMPRCNVNKISDCQFMCQKNQFCKAFQYAPAPGLTGQCTTGECYLAREYATENNVETYAGAKFCGIWIKIHYYIFYEFDISFFNIMN